MSSILKNLKLLKSRILNSEDTKNKTEVLDENEMKVRRQQIEKILKERMQEVKKYQKYFKVEVSGIIVKVSQTILDNCQFEINKDFFIDRNSNDYVFLDIPNAYFQVVLSIIRSFQRENQEYNIDNPLEINLNIHEDVFQIKQLIKEVFVDSKVLELVKLNKYVASEYRTKIDTLSVINPPLAVNNRRGGRNAAYDNGGYNSEYDY